MDTVIVHTYANKLKLSVVIAHRRPSKPMNFASNSNENIAQTHWNDQLCSEVLGFVSVRPMMHTRVYCDETLFAHISGDRYQRLFPV